MKINLIIPSAGLGQRFVNAGYSIYKPFIEVFEKAMIKHVIDLFGIDVNLIIIAAKSCKTDFEHCFNNCKCSILYIEDHKNGPAYSIYKVIEHIKPDEAYFVAYNDIIWSWDIYSFQEFIITKHPDVVVLTHSGFHPHLYKNNYSAFCKLSVNGEIYKIREKGSFTDDWMQEELSVGVFYFRKGKNLKSAISKLISEDQRVASEFFPSVSINYLIEEGKHVLPYDVKSFIHWGIPQQLNDMLRWERIFSRENPETNCNICMMLCGTGERLKPISNVNKAGMIVSRNTMMYEYILKKLGSSNVSLIINENSDKIINKKYNTINISFSTISQTESLYLALSEIKKMRNTIFTSNDCFGSFNYEQLVKYNNCDIVLFGFKPSLLQQKQDFAHTYFKSTGNKVTDILIKTKSQDDYALAGLFYVPDGKIFEQLQFIDFSVDTSFDHFVNYLIKKGKDIRFVIMDDYVHLGTIEEFNEFKYWQEFYDKK